MLLPNDESIVHTNKWFPNFIPKDYFIKTLIYQTKKNNMFLQ